MKFAPSKILLGGKSPQICIYIIPAQETAEEHANNNVGQIIIILLLASVERHRCSSEAKTSALRISDMRSKFALRPRHVWKYGRHPFCDG